MLEGLIAGAASILVSIVAWLISDGKSKSRLVFLEEKISVMRASLDQIILTNQERISALDIKLARSEQDRLDIHRMVERLDITKASKDVVDGFKGEISTLKVDMDKRFDRIERLIEKSTLGKNGVRIE